MLYLSPLQSTEAAAVLKGQFIQTTDFLHLPLLLSNSADSFGLKEYFANLGNAFIHFLADI